MLLVISHRGGKNILSLKSQWLGQVSNPKPKSHNYHSSNKKIKVESSAVLFNCIKRALSVKSTFLRKVIIDPSLNLILKPSSIYLNLIRYFLSELSEPGLMNNHCIIF